MLSLLLSVAFLFGDGNGPGILPLTSKGGSVAITVVAYVDGSYAFTGTAWGVPILGSGYGSWESGRFQFECSPIFGDADLITRQGTPVPLKVTADIDPADCQDGDPIDDEAGTMDLRSQTGAGRGCIELRA